MNSKRILKKSEVGFFGVKLSEDLLSRVSAKLDDFIVEIKFEAKGFEIGSELKDKFPDLFEYFSHNGCEEIKFEIDDERVVELENWFDEKASKADLEMIARIDKYKNIWVFDPED